MSLENAFRERTINELVLMFKNRQINLEPGFQRNSVWGIGDRRRLIQSIVAQYPLPSIFLYQRHHNGRLIYDVIDGKQRLETILMFLREGRFARESFAAKLDIDDEHDWFDWTTLKRRHPNVRLAFETYNVQTAEVKGELPAIVDLFVRINSTGKPLTTGEKRNARFYRSPFLKAANQLVARFQQYFLHQRILSETQLDRMKGTELVAELLMSLHRGGIINKKTALDRAIGNESVNGNTLGRLVRECAMTLHAIRKMFPDLRTRRFHNTAELYTLFLIVWELRKAGLILNDRRRNKTAALLLQRLSNGVDELRDQLRHARPAKLGQRLYADYLLTVQGDTDSSASRERRGELVRGLLWNVFERKDQKRLFSPEQRRLVWNTDEKKTCTKCKKALTWENFTVDHILAHARGGATALKNAQLMCRPCNSGKGAR